MKIQNNKTKIATTITTVLVLTMIIPFSGINMAYAQQSTSDPFNIGKVEDGTYNEHAALLRAAQLMGMYHAEMEEKSKLEQKLKTANNPENIQGINNQINTIQGQIDQIKQEFDAIQAENYKYYYVAPVLLKKYQAAADNFFNFTTTQLWKGKGTFEEQMNAFPFVGIGVNGKDKAVEITLWKGSEKSANSTQYLNIIKSHMPTDVPWFVDYAEYKLLTCPSQTNECSPLIGGIQIGISQGGTAYGQCTLGFDATRTSDSHAGFVTAGHCEQGYTGNTVWQPSPATSPYASVGTASTSVFSNGSDCDCGWVSLDSGVSISDQIWEGSSSTFQPTSVTPQSQQTDGKIAQMMGGVTGIASGSIVSNDYELCINANCILHYVNGKFASQQGDSGSPVLDSTGTSIYGVVSAGNGTNTVWSPEDRAAADLGVTIITG
ncbi:MAG: hypothetical protein KGI09_07995 [Thaumarchaeota archaeon]|nr:hypothetical protein [Nitrososphaerota archaeon]